MGRYDSALAISQSQASMVIGNVNGRDLYQLEGELCCEFLVHTYVCLCKINDLFAIGIINISGLPKVRVYTCSPWTIYLRRPKPWTPKICWP